MNAVDMFMSLTPERLGRLGEAVCSSIFRGSGLTYVPLCEMAAKGAPLANSADGGIILPDFDVCELQAYIDAKAKTQPVLYRRTGEVRHGINKKNYEHYVAMGATSHKMCGLMIIELFDDSRTTWSGSILTESFRHLGRPKSGFNEDPPKVYWNRERFALIGRYSPDELRNIANGRRAIDCRQELESIFYKAPERCEVHGIDPSDIIDEPPVAGRIRSHCRRCGCFYGYRPVGRE